MWDAGDGTQRSFRPCGSRRLFVPKYVCRISSSDRGSPGWFKLDQHIWPVLRGRYRTVVNCNPKLQPGSLILSAD
jgi:hypothetical protein